MPTNLPMYSKNPVSSFPNLSSTYVSSSVVQTIGIFVGEKLNGQNYYLWSQTVKMILEGCHKFGFLIEEISRPPPSGPQERIWKEEDPLIR